MSEINVASSVGRIQSQASRATALVKSAATEESRESAQVEAAENRKAAAAGPTRAPSPEGIGGMVDAEA